MALSLSPAHGNGHQPRNSRMELRVLSFDQGYHSVIPCSFYVSPRSKYQPLPSHTFAIEAHAQYRHELENVRYNMIDKCGVDPTGPQTMEDDGHYRRLLQELLNRPGSGMMEVVIRLQTELQEQWKADEQEDKERMMNSASLEAELNKMTI